MCDISDPSPSTKHHGDCPHLGRIGDQCAVTCNHGYLPGAGMRPFTCSADGKWVGGHVNCTAVKCPAEHDSDMSWDSDMENPGDNVTCAEGSYDPTDPSVCRVDARSGVQLQVCQEDVSCFGSFVIHEASRWMSA